MQPLCVFTLFALSSSLPSTSPPSKVPSASALQDISLNRISSGSQLPASALRATSKLRTQIPGGTDLALACASSALHAIHHIPRANGAQTARMVPGERSPQQQDKGELQAALAKYDEERRPVEAKAASRRVWLQGAEGSRCVSGRGCHWRGLAPPGPLPM